MHEWNPNDLKSGILLGREIYSLGRGMGKYLESASQYSFDG